MAVKHVPCEICGSSDNRAVFEDGGEKCFTPGCPGYAPPRAARGAKEEKPPEATEATLSDSSLTFDEFTIGPLPSRKITQETAARYGYGRATYRGRRCQAAPYHDSKGRVVAYKLRFPDKSFQWIGSKRDALPLFGQTIQGAGKRLVVTEGELDALACAQVLGNWPVVSLPDGAGSVEAAFTKALGFLSGFEAVVLAFDMDEPGRAAVETAANILPPGVAHIAHLPLKDACEMLRAGRGSELRSRLWGASRWEPEGLLAGESLLESIRDGQRPTVLHYPYPLLDSMTRGVRKGEIIMLVGASGAGKSTFVRSLTHELVVQGVKIGVISLEETAYEFMVPLVGYEMGVNTRLVEGDPTEDPAFVEAFNRLSKNIVMYDDRGDRDLDRLFSVADFMVHGEGCDLILLDHLTILLASQSGRGSVSDTDQFMAKLQGLVKRSGVTLAVIMHLRKTDQGKTFEEGRVPTLSDIRGSGLIAAFAHTIIARVRDQCDSNDGGQLHLLKCRLGGTGRLGAADKLVFDPDVGCLRSEFAVNGTGDEF